MDYGDGWAEVEIEGRGRGMVPASYVSLLVCRLFDSSPNGVTDSTDHERRFSWSE